ncbi:MAG: hypothetical protein AAGA60_23065 [Cyanobacteria bacterium P01_E01_bin.42]
MNAIQFMRERLSKYPDISFEVTENSICVAPTNENGFSISMYVDRDEYEVYFEGWHENFQKPEQALECFAFGLSNSCRLKVIRRGNTPCQWTLESLENGTWIPDSQVGLLLVPFWRAKTVIYLQNNLIED